MILSNDYYIQFIKKNKYLKISLIIVKNNNIRLKKIANNLIQYAYYLYKKFIIIRIIRKHKNFLKRFMLSVFMLIQLKFIYIYQILF